jgi:hypothetical protein
MSQSPIDSGWSLISTRKGPNEADGGTIVNLKLSQAALSAVPQSAEPVGALTGPVQVTLGLASEIVPDPGVALSEGDTKDIARIAIVTQKTASVDNLTFSATEAMCD